MWNARQMWSQWVMTVVWIDMEWRQGKVRTDRRRRGMDRSQMERKPDCGGRDEQDVLRRHLVHLVQSHAAGEHATYLIFVS